METASHKEYKPLWPGPPRKVTTGEQGAAAALEVACGIRTPISSSSTERAPPSPRVFLPGELRAPSSCVSLLPSLLLVVLLPPD